MAASSSATSTEEQIALVDLPEELQSRVFHHLKAKELAGVICTRKAWRSLAAVCAEEQACDIVSAPYRAHTAGGRRNSSGPCWLRVLQTCEDLQERVGAAPTHSWQDEWVALQLESLRLREAKVGPDAEARLAALLTPEVIAEISKQWEPGGPNGIEHALRDVAVSVEWKVAQGWERRTAEAYTLIASIFKAALGHAMRSGSAAFAASTHLLCTALSDQAWRAHSSNDVAPLVYKDLGGTYGLVTNDPAVWSVLDTTEAPALGTTFRWAQRHAPHAPPRLPSPARLLSLLSPLPDAPPARARAAAPPLCSRPLRVPPASPLRASARPSTTRAGSSTNRRPAP